MALLCLHDGGSADEAERIARGFGGKPPCGLRERHGPDPPRYTHGRESFAVPKRSPSSPRRTTIVLKRWPPRVRALHSYETPCIVALPVARGDADFLAWITESTHPEE